VSRVVFLALFVVGFPAAGSLFPLSLSLSSNEPPVAAAPKQAAPAAIRRRATHHYFPLSLPTSPTLFPQYSQPPRAPSSLQRFLIIIIHTVTRSSVATRPTSRLDFSRQFRFEHRPRALPSAFTFQPPCLPSTIHTHIPTTTHLSARSRPSESRLDLLINSSSRLLLQH
jgi:hypothetical protein